MEKETSEGNRQHAGAGAPRSDRPARAGQGAARTLIFTVCVAAGLTSLTSSGRAEKANFGDLLARAHAEIAAGHQWAPAGDNVAETFIAMMDLLSQATPEQLADFQALLQIQQEQLGRALKQPSHSPPGERAPDKASEQALNLGSANSSAADQASSLRPPVEMSRAGAANQSQANQPGAIGPGNAAAAERSVAAAEPAPEESRATPSSDRRATAEAGDPLGGSSGPAEQPGIKGRGRLPAAESVLASREMPARAEPPALGGTPSPAHLAVDSADVSTQPAPRAPAPPVQTQTAAPKTPPPADPRLATREMPSPAAPPPAIDGTPSPVHPAADSADVGTQSAPRVPVPPVQTQAAAPKTPPPADPVLAKREMPAPAAMSAFGRAPSPAHPAAGNADVGTQPAPTAPAPQPAAAPTALTRQLFGFGQAAEARGDVSGARRYYETAANQGLAEAALALGRLYDPAYVRRNTLGGIEADPATARQWYQRAASLGDTKAQPLLKTLSAR